MTTEYHRYEFNETMLEKRQRLLDAGKQPYPYSFEGGKPICEVVAEATTREAAEQELEFAATVAGRIWAVRKMGKSTFADLRDSSGKIQLYVHKSVNGTDECPDFGDLDLGDIVGVSGAVFRTRTGELSIKLESAVVLSKVVVPIPMGKEAEGQAFNRATDPEIQYRERYIHWMLDETDRERMRKRSAIISAVRRRMEADGFLEVQTPTVEFVYGGAEARPFETEIWALGHRKAFLRISPELYLKRYIVAGFEKVYTICQNFRNEGIDRSHNPEFTMMEWYEAYTDYTVQMRRFETLVAGVVEEITGGLKVTYQGTEIDFTTPWRRITMLDALKGKGIDADAMSIDQLREEMTKREIKHDPSIPWGLAVAELFETLCEEDLIQPTIVIDHPKDISPLTKTKRGDDRLVERFEPYVCRMELGNAYSELTDPVDQLDRLLAQRDVKREGEEADVHHHPVDADFVKAIGCGMPPTGGVGIGIERLIMLLTDASTIRDIIPFPMIKPKSDQE